MQKDLLPQVGRRSLQGLAHIRLQSIRQRTMEFPQGLSSTLPPSSHADTTHEVTAGTRNARPDTKGGESGKTHSHCVGGISSLCEE